MIGFLLTKTDVAHWNLTMQLITAVHALYNPIISSMYPIMIKEKSLKIVHKIILIYLQREAVRLGLLQTGLEEQIIQFYIVTIMVIYIREIIMQEVLMQIHLEI